MKAEGSTPPGRPQRSEALRYEQDPIPPEDCTAWSHFTLDFSSSSKTGFLGRAGGEGISVLSTGIGGSDCTMPAR